MPVAYLVVESNISDPEAFKHYMAAAPDVVKQQPLLENDFSC